MITHAIVGRSAKDSSATKTELLRVTMALGFVVGLVSALRHFVLKHQELMLKLFILQEEIEVDRCPILVFLAYRYRSILLSRVRQGQQEGALGGLRKILD